MSRLQKIRDEANALERDMMEMEMALRKQEIALKQRQMANAVNG